MAQTIGSYRMKTSDTVVVAYKNEEGRLMYVGSYPDKETALAMYGPEGVYANVLKNDPDPRLMFEINREPTYGRSLGTLVHVPGRPAVAATSDSVELRRT